MLPDARFLELFYQAELEQLSHQDHVRIAWLVLQDESLLSALRILKQGLRNFTRSRGKPDLYHETVTWAFTILINERIQGGRAGTSWQEFLALNPDLNRGLSILEGFYEPRTLDSELARNHFILPDRGCEKNLP